jgi:hypothetical protein
MRSGSRGCRPLDPLTHQVVFADAQFPSTRAPVSSVFTSLYPAQHSLVAWVLETKVGPVSVIGWHEGVPPLAEILAGTGHFTAAFVAGNRNPKPIFRLARGFGSVGRVGGGLPVDVTELTLVTIQR